MDQNQFDFSFPDNTITMANDSSCLPASSSGFTGIHPEKRHKSIFIYLFFILLFSLFLISTAYGERYKLDMDIDFTSLNSGLNMDIFLNENIIATISSDKSHSLSADIMEGKNILRLSIADHHSIYKDVILNIHHDVKIRCLVSVYKKNYDLYIKEVETEPASMVATSEETELEHCLNCHQLVDPFFDSCIYCGGNLPRYNTLIHLKFAQNLIFSRYGVKVFIDNNQYLDLPHGHTEDLKLLLSTGKHILRLQKEDDPKVFIDKEIEISEGTEINCSFETKADGIHVEYFGKESFPRKFIVLFRRTYDMSEERLEFDKGTRTFTSLSYYHRKKGDQKYSVGGTGKYTLDQNGILTLTYDKGTIRKYLYEVIFSQSEEKEILYKISESGEVYKEGKPGEEIYERRSPLLTKRR